LKRDATSPESKPRQRDRVIVSRPFVAPQKTCNRCAEPSGLITPDEGAALCQVSTRTIYRWLESGLIHFSETGSEGLFICLQTLAGKNISKPVRHYQTNSRIKR